MNSNKVAITEKASYWLTRILFLRSLAFIYVVAFLIAKLQNIQLIGYKGLTPADLFMQQYKNYVKLPNLFSLFFSCPTILWFLPMDNGEIDFYLDLISWFGLVLSSYVLLSGKANMLTMFLLWLFYHSIVNVGQIWYSFGWESQLLETGFIGIFMCHGISLKMFSINNKPSFVPLILGRWLIFRIMIGAGMIKIRGDKCWRDLTCMNYHYETQPVPNPLSYYLHQEPLFIHKFETLMNHFIELVAPFLLLLIQPFVMFGGMIQILFQVVLIISGNLSFLNWVTMVPSICCFEDKHIQFLFSNKTIKSVNKINELLHNPVNNIWCRLVDFVKKIRVVDVILLFLVGILSLPVIKNVLSPNQVMNTSYNSFRIVNTYGAFGSITKTRKEVIIEGTDSEYPYLKSTVWKEYEFKCKPGNVFRRPCILSPYHYRLDWLMWFAGFQTAHQNIWLYHLIYKLLKNDDIVNELIAFNPFQKKPPKSIRASHYIYKFCKIGDANSNSSQWWERQYIGEYIQPINLDSFKEIAKSYHWNR